MKRDHTVPLAASLLVTLGLCTPTVAQSAPPEIRAMWVSRFEWPNASPAIAQARIDTIMQDLADRNFNAVFFQVRGQADVLYPSPYEVWSPLIGGADPGWDPLAYAIDAAHSRGLRFHAYFNTHTCWQSSEHVEPSDSDHLFFAHCDASNPAARDWLIHDLNGTPVQWHENNYVWIAPGVPAYQAYLRKQVLYLVSSYDVDGIHFDRIRTPNSSFSYDPISQARRASPQSNPGGLDFSRWTRDQITRNVRDIYAAVMGVKPGVAVSAAVFPDPNTAPAGQHQDALIWAQTGGLDILVPMMYSTGGAGSTWDNRLKAWLLGSSGRHVVAGQITTEGGTWLLNQVALTRTRGAQGNSVFSWSSFTFWDDYLVNVYQQPASTPSMAWKQNPSTGILWGYARDATGALVVDAQVTRPGDAIISLSSGDGFYSMLLVAPGTHSLSATHMAYGPGVPANATVAAGQVVRRDLTIGELLAPLIAAVEPNPERVLANFPYTRQLTLSQGLADTWTLLEGPTGAVVNAQGSVSGWTPTEADAGETIRFTVRAVNAAGADEETWQLVVEGPSCTILRISDFEGFAGGEPALLRVPTYSGSTVSHLLGSPNMAQVTDAVAYKGSKCSRIEWQFVDALPERWLRLTTFGGAGTPNPTVALDRPIRIRMRVESGRFRLCAGIRETGTTAELGADGGTTGTIEWIGATSKIVNAPQGVLVEAAPGVWQTFVFDPRSAPILAMTGDGVLATPTGKGVLEQLAFSSVDTAGPFFVYLDDIDQLCPTSPFGDFDGDGHVNLLDFPTLTACCSGATLPIAVPACAVGDADGDGDVDADDFGAFQRCFSGSVPQLNPACAW